MNFLEYLRSLDRSSPVINSDSAEMKLLVSQVKEVCTKYDVRESLPLLAAEILAILDSVIHAAAFKLDSIEDRDIEENLLVRLEMKAQLLSAQLSRYVESGIQEVKYQEAILQRLIRNLSQEILPVALALQAIFSKREMFDLASMVEESFNQLVVLIRVLPNDMSLEVETIVEKLDL